MHAADAPAQVHWWQPAIGLLALIIWIASGACGLRTAPPDTRRFAPGAGLSAFAAALVASVAATLILAGVMGVPLAPDKESMTQSLIIQAVSWAAQLAAVGCVLWVAVGMTQPTPLGDDRRPSHMRSVGIGLVGLALFWPMTLAAASVAALISSLVTGQAPSPIAHDLLRDLVHAWPSPEAQLMAASVVIGPAVVEEVLYRGLLQESIRRLVGDTVSGRWVAIISTSLLFMVVHVGAIDIHGLMGIFVLSVGFGWVYMRTGRLIAPIAMHVLFNLGNILLVVL